MSGADAGPVCDGSAFDAGPVFDGGAFDAGSVFDGTNQWVCTTIGGGNYTHLSAKDGGCLWRARSCVLKLH